MLQGILEQSAVQNYPLGMRIAVDDRVFRYCRAIEAIGSCKGAYSDAQEYWEAGVVEIEDLDLIQVKLQAILRNVDEALEVNK